MRRNFTLLFLFVAMAVASKAAYIPVAVTGFNTDVVANGVGAPSITSNAALDDGTATTGFVFCAQDYNYDGTCAAIAAPYYLPNGGLVSSVATPGLSFQLDNYSSNNNLRLWSSLNTGTLTFSTPISAGEVFFLATSGAAASTISATVTFTDATTQVFTASISDWYSAGSNVVVLKAARVSRTKITCGNDGNPPGDSGPNLYEFKLSLSPGNYTKQIASITFTRTNATNSYVNIMAISVNPICSTPSDQPTSLTLNTANSQVTGSFLPALSSPSNYLVVRYPTASTPTSPVNGTIYSVGGSLGTGTVVSTSSTSAFTANGVVANTSYDFYIYSFNYAGCVGGPIYNVTTPLTGNIMVAACGGPGNTTLQIGPGYLYTSITDAITAISASGISGPVIMELQSNYNSGNETFPITIPFSSCINSVNSLTIRPAASASGLTISSSNAGPTIDLNGASNIIIDGRPGGFGSTGLLQVINTNNSGAPLRFINDASNNTITYCDFQGQNSSITTTVLSGVIYFSTASATYQNGNDNNTISFCKVHGTSTSTTPALGIVSNGSITTAGSYNENNVINSCNIYDYFQPTINSTGIKLDQGNSTWSVINNYFYQSLPRVYTAIATHRIMHINSNPNASSAITPQASGFNISGNLIGGNGSGGNYDISGGTLTHNFLGMDISVGVGAPTVIRNNTYYNISFSTANVSATTPNFSAIHVNYGNVNVRSNNIGDPTTPGSITLTRTGTSATAGLAAGIRIAGGITNNVDSNVISNFNLIGSSTAPYSFAGIYITGGSAGTNGITNNIIGNATNANSIVCSSPTSGTQIMYGIWVTGALANTISQNTIANLTNSGTGTGVQMFGISLTTSAPTITNNSIHDFINASANAGTGASSSTLGINMSSTTAPFNISGNTIYNLKSITTTVASSIQGIFITGATTGINIVAKNFIYRISTPSTNASSVISGMTVNGGVATYSNNMIALGYDEQNNPIPNSVIIRGLVKNGTTSNNFYHNSVHIGGAVSQAGTSRSFAFNRSNTAGIDTVVNNIFMNERSGNGTHYAISFGTNTSTGGVTTGVYLNNNVYYANGTGGMFGFTTVDVPTYTQGWVGNDTNSYFANPQFVNPTAAGGGGGVPDLHISASLGTPVEGTGKLISSIADDFDGEVRAANTPVDIGADAGIFVAWPVCATPNAPTVLNLTAISSSQIDGSFTAAAGGSDGYIVVKYATGATPVSPVNGTSYLNGNTLGTGSVISNSSLSTFSSTGLLAATSYTYYVYAYRNVSCTAGPKYSLALIASQSTQACSGQSGTITVGPTGTYTTLGAAVTSLSSGISSSVILELQSSYTSAGETFPITINSNACFTPVNTVTIRPAIAANGLVISGANAGPAIDFVGAQYVTIDGTPGGSSVSSIINVTPAGSTNATNLNIINTNTAGMAIRMDNQASNNTVKYCDLQGQNNTAVLSSITAGGVVLIGNTSGANGNDNNVIDHCNIHSTGTSVPSLGIYAVGPTNNGLNANFNDNGVISNNNIYDFFHAGASSIGVMLNDGINGWTVSNNSFFQTATRTYTTTGFYTRAIWIITDRNTGSVGNGFNVTGNYIGGSSPLCGGTAYTITGLSNYMEGMRFEVVDGTVPNPSSVQGNVIRNISETSTQTGDAFHAIWSNGRGSLNIGNITGNTVGSTTGTGGAITGGITIASGLNSPNHMIIMTPASGSTPAINISNNTVGNILLSNAGNNFSGIFVNNTPTVVINNNLIGSLTTANSIYTSSTSTTAGWLRGITVPSGANTVTITDNTIANLNSASTSTTSGNQVAGIHVASTASTIPSITGNTIFNLSSAGASTASGINASLLGIGMVGAVTGCNISSNTIHSLVSSAASAAVYLEGIFYAGSTSTSLTTTISKNFVHSFDVTNSGNTSANLRGIENNAGQANFHNNMVRLGIRPDGTDLVNSVKIDGLLKGSGQNNNLFFNSVYIGGTATGTTTSNTASFRKETTLGTDDLRDNIFVNVRTNATTGGKHYVINTSAATGQTFNYNLYQYSSDFASTNAGSSTTNATYTSGWNSSDLNSLVGNPQYLNPLGTSSSVNLHINPVVPTLAEGYGIAIPAVSDDIDGDIRANFSPTDIGADAGNFTQQPLSIKLVRFNGQSQGSTNRITWLTSDEAKEDIFQLERSENGIDFSLLGVINAVGQPSGYTFIDEKPFAVSYYRLKMLETSGKINLSETIVIKSADHSVTELKVFPNPASDKLNVIVSNIGSGGVITVTDLAGKILKESFVSGSNMIIETKDWPAGIYLLKYNNEKTSQAVKITKQ
jgi:trimeric autotransporter adhesin